MNLTRTCFWQRALIALLFLTLTACGGGSDESGGGGGSEDGGDGSESSDGNGSSSSAPSNENAILVNTPDALSEAIAFDGGYSVDGDIPAPAEPTGGSLSITSELAVTAGGTSPLSIRPNLADGQYVHAYFIQLEGSNKTFIVPVGPDGQPQTQNVRSLAADDVPGRLRKASTANGSQEMRMSAASDGEEQFRLNCTGRPVLEFEVGALEYQAPAQVQAYTKFEMPMTAGPYSLPDFQIEPQYWTEPAELNIKAVDVGGGSFQVTLNWDSTADVDLHLQEPDSNVIHYSNTRSNAGDGYLDYDDTDGHGPENIYFENNVPPGLYTVKVHMFNGWGDELPTDYSVTVKRDGAVNTYTGTLVNDGEEDVVTSFTLAGSGGSGSGSGGLGSGGSDTGGFESGGSGSGVSSGSGSAGSGSGDLELGACGVTIDNVYSVCYTNYPIEACELMDSQLSSTADVMAYYSTSCGGGYNCLIDFEDYDTDLPMDCYN